MDQVLCATQELAFLLCANCELTAAQVDTIQTPCAAAGAHQSDMADVDNLHHDDVDHHEHAARGPGCTRKRRCKGDFALVELSCVCPRSEIPSAEAGKTEAPQIARGNVTTTEYVAACEKVLDATKKTAEQVAAFRALRKIYLELEIRIVDETLEARVWERVHSILGTRQPLSLVDAAIRLISALVAQRPAVSDRFVESISFGEVVKIITASVEAQTLSSGER